MGHCANRLRHIDGCGVLIELVEPTAAKHRHIDRFECKAVGWQQPRANHADGHASFSSTFEKESCEILRVDNVGGEELVQSTPHDTTETDAEVGLLPGRLDVQFLRSNDPGSSDRLLVAIRNQPFGKA